MALGSVIGIHEIYRQTTNDEDTLKRRQLLFNVMTDVMTAVGE